MLKNFYPVRNPTFGIYNLQSLQLHFPPSRKGCLISCSVKVTLAMFLKSVECRCCARCSHVSPYFVLNIRHVFNEILEVHENGSDRNTCRSPKSLKKSLLPINLSSNTCELCKMLIEIRQ